MFFKYEIKNGDSLNKIASRYHTTKEFIKDINNIYFEDKLRVGSEIIVPSNDVIYFDKYLINNGDTLYAIANKVNSNPKLIANINGMNMDDYIYPGNTLLVPKKDFKYYITKEGDTLKMVSEVFNSSLENVINNNSTIYLLPNQIMVSKK